MRQLRSPLRLILASAVIAALALPWIAGGRATAQQHWARTAHVASASVAVSGATVTVRGRVRIHHGTRTHGTRVRILLTLTDSHRDRERRTARLDGRDRFHVSWSTQLSGHLTLRVRVTVGGKRYGAVITRSFSVIPSARPTGTPLVGTFKLDPGAAPSGQAPAGSYFEMLTPSGGPLANLSSPASNKNYTPFTPGSDGGLRTDAYQPAPGRAFAGGTSGGALANKIIQPVPFYLINFSIETSSTDAQLGSHDPLPAIYERNGSLTGQVTAWVAQWNGQSFNQGTPKPNGSVPPPTTPVSGTYDAGSHRFTLQWKSLIVGGPFNGFTGVWHLAGTFVPAHKSILPLPLATL